MGLEAATTIAGLNSANPLSSDQKNQGDDHLRLIKAVLLADAMGLSTVHAGTSKATPVDADEIPIVDSLALTTIKKLTWANLKATLKTYNDTLYAATGANSDITSLAGLTTPLSVGQGGIGAATLTVNNVLLGNGTSAPQAVAPSTSGNVLTSNGTTWQSAAPVEKGVGIGQTWQNVTGSRVANGTTYTNSTSKPIMVSVMVNAPANVAGGVYLTVGGVVVAHYYDFNYNQSEIHTVTTIVPPSTNYSATLEGTATLNSWVELRA